MNIKTRFRSRSKPLILDGALGSLLQQYDAVNDENLWTSIANLTQPQLIKNIYYDYIISGADIITTNTFRTNPIAYKKGKLEISNKDFVKKTVELTIQSRTGNTIIAGCNPPAEDCYKIERSISYEELAENHKNHISQLYDCGVDFILNETMSHFDEIKISAEYCFQNKIPFITSIFFNDDLTILSGENVHDVINYLQNLDPIIISFNCISLDTFIKLTNQIDLNKIHFGFYLNCGSGNNTDKEITCGVSPKEYADFVKDVLILNPKLIGSCCGSNPNHTKELRKLVDEVYRN